MVAVPRPLRRAQSSSKAGGGPQRDGIPGGVDHDRDLVPGTRRTVDHCAPNNARSARAPDAPLLVCPEWVSVGRGKSAPSPSPTPRRPTRLAQPGDAIRGQSRLPRLQQQGLVPQRGGDVVADGGVAVILAGVCATARPRLWITLLAQRAWPGVGWAVRASVGAGRSDPPNGTRRGPLGEHVVVFPIDARVCARSREAGGCCGAAPGSRPLRRPGCAVGPNGDPLCRGGHAP